MAIKGTLATFHIAKLGDVTVDERRSVRNFIKENSTDVSQPSLEVIQTLFKDCMISDDELALVEKGKSFLAPIHESITWIQQDVNDSNYEGINVTRMKSTVEEVPLALDKNLVELRKVMDIQHTVPIAVKDILEAAARGDVSSAPANSMKLFCMISNNDECKLFPEERINEAQQSHIKDLAERFGQGYIYHWSIQDELNKVPFQEIFAKLNAAQQEEYKKLLSLLNELNSSVDMAYQANWKQIALIRRTYSVLHECLKKYFE